jgi:hypothetical protein
MRYRKRRRAGTVDRFGHDMNCPSSVRVRVAVHCLSAETFTRVSPAGSAAVPRGSR